jgi:DNA-binding transcriptional regulator YiaG
LPSVGSLLKIEFRKEAATLLRASEKRARKTARQLRGMRKLVRAQQRQLAILERRLERLRSRLPIGRKASASTSVRALRARLKLSRAKFAKLVGVSSGAVYLWESGRSQPRGSSLALLARVRSGGNRRVTKHQRRRRGRRATGARRR